MTDPNQLQGSSKEREPSETTPSFVPEEISYGLDPGVQEEMASEESTSLLERTTEDPLTEDSSLSNIHSSEVIYTQDTLQNIQEATAQNEVGIASIIPRDSHGRIRWALLYEQNPELLMQYIESEVQACMHDGIAITAPALRSAGKHSLVKAIQRYFPGELSGLRKKLGLPSVDKWKPAEEITPEMIENLESEAQQFIKEGNALTTPDLKRAGRADLQSAINRYYPGKLKALQKKLGIKNKYLNHETDEFGLPIEESGKTHWEVFEAEPERLIAAIEAKVGNFLEQGNLLNAGSLNQNGGAHLLGAIARYYPGGLAEIQKRFGLEKAYEKNERGLPIDPQGRIKWSALADQPEKLQLLIEAEARAHLANGLSLEQKSLIESGRSDLVAAIRIYYPGQLSALKRRLFIGNGWEHLQSFEDWKSEFIKQDEWQGRSIAELRKDEESHFAAFIEAFDSWLLRNITDRSERIKIRGEFFSSVSLPVLDDDGIYRDGEEEWVSRGWLARELELRPKTLTKRLMLVAKIRGQTRHGEPCMLYKKSEAIALLKNIEQNIQLTSKIADNLFDELIPD